MQKVNAFQTFGTRCVKQAGFSLAEVALVLVIVGIVFVGALSAFRSSSNSSDIQMEAQNFASIVATARGLRQNGSYAAVTNAALQRVSGFGNMSGSATGGTVRHRWGGTVVATGTASSLTITYADVPTAACDRFLNMVRDSGLI